MGKKPLNRNSSTPVVTEPEKCSGCGRCVAACPENLYSLEINGHRKYAVSKNPAQCSLCKKCQPACPLAIIR